MTTDKLIRDNTEALKWWEGLTTYEVEKYGVKYFGNFLHNFNMGEIAKIHEREIPSNIPDNLRQYPITKDDAKKEKTSEEIMQDIIVKVEAMEALNNIMLNALKQIANDFEDNEAGGFNEVPMRIIAKNAIRDCQLLAKQQGK